MDKITAVGQKGYSTKRYCQEVVISILEGISKCKSSNIKGAVVSLDIKKAFDSISNTYLESCLRFFNFGEKFIGVIKLLCTNRKASIILGQNRCGKSFRLERGNAQGDTISPFLFNIGYQILLLKINTDLQIESFLDLPALPAGHHPPPAAVSTSPWKAFAFADDCTVLTLLTEKNLKRLKEILDQFELLSGLECNVEKSHLLPVGNDRAVPVTIRAIGFEVLDEITVLGIKIKGSDGSTSSTESTVTNKIKSNITFWSCFNLSLPGRICIAKTMLCSQLNYMGCFLPVSYKFVTDSENQIADFVKGNINISSKKIFENPASGGLGLFKVADFLDGQCCSWLKRAINCDELWKYNLYVNSPGTIIRVNKNMVNKNLHPILHGFAGKFDNLVTAHTITNQNYKKGYIFNNKAFTFGVRSREVLDEVSWEVDFNAAEKFCY
jgi:hypothetical protein